MEYHVKSGMMNRHQVQFKNQKAKELKQTFVQKLAMEKLRREVEENSRLKIEEQVGCRF